MADIIIIIIAISIVGFALYRAFSNKKQGKSSCGCGCSSCPSESDCSSK